MQLKLIRKKGTILEAQTPLDVSLAMNFETVTTGNLPFVAGLPFFIFVFFGLFVVFDANRLIHMSKSKSLDLFSDFYGRSDIRPIVDVGKVC